MGLCGSDDEIGSGTMGTIPTLKRTKRKYCENLLGSTKKDWARVGSH
jgi:hypothetical protein